MVEPFMVLQCLALKLLAQPDPTKPHGLVKIEPGFRLAGEVVKGNASLQLGLQRGVGGGLNVLRLQDAGDGSG